MKKRKKKKKNRAGLGNKQNGLTLRGYVVKISQGWHKWHFVTGLHTHKMQEINKCYQYLILACVENEANSRWYFVIMVCFYPQITTILYLVSIARLFTLYFLFFYNYIFNCFMFVCSVCSASLSSSCENMNYITEIYILEKLN